MSKLKDLWLLPQTPRVFVMVRVLRPGRPVSVWALARTLRCSETQVKRYLSLLINQGCLIDLFDDHVRMVDDHTSASDAELEHALLSLLVSRSRRGAGDGRRRNAA